MENQPLYTAPQGGVAPYGTAQPMPQGGYAPYGAGQPMPQNGYAPYGAGQPMPQNGYAPYGAGQPMPQGGYAPYGVGQPMPQNGYAPYRAVQPGAPATGYPPQLWYTPQPVVKNTRVKKGAKSFNRMSLVSLAQYVAAFVIEIPLVYALLAVGANVYNDPLMLVLLEGAMVPITTALPFLIVGIFSRPKLPELVIFRRTDRVLSLLLIVAGLGIVMLGNLPAMWLQDFMGQAGYEPMEQVAEPTSLPVYLVEFAVTAILVPIMEEFAFRGVLLSRLKRYGAGFALVGSAMIFALAHMDISTVIFAFIAGLVFGFLYLRTGNLWLSIAVHMLNNGIAMLESSGDLLFPPATLELLNEVLFYAPILLGAVALVLIVLCKRPKLMAPLNDATLEQAPLNAGESLQAYVRAPAFWLLVGVSLLFTFTRFLG